MLTLQTPPFYHRQGVSYTGVPQQHSEGGKMHRDMEEKENLDDKNIFRNKPSLQRGQESKLICQTHEIFLHMKSKFLVPLFSLSEPVNTEWLL